jgi:LCP family protein required for cell wall assembly
MSRNDLGEGPSGKPARRNPGRGTRAPVKGTGAPAQGTRASVKQRVAAWISISLTIALVAISLGVYWEYYGAVKSIHHVAITDLGKRPPKYTNALNILMIGSDSRAGANKKFGASLADGGQRSDTVILLHLSPGRHRATVLSFPRDTVVPTLACAAHGTGTPGQLADPSALERINATFANGGPSCLYKTVEQETGIRLDHFVELNFTGFEHVVNDIGGVSICLPFAVNNPESGLVLSKGEHHVGGKLALAFWRTRENIGEGSDLQRIQRDQYLMASLLQGVEHSDILGSPTRVFSVVKDAASAMTTDMDLSNLVQVASSARGLSTKSVQFIEVPTGPYPGDPEAEVEFQQPQAGALFSALAHDKTLPKAKKKGTVTPVLDSASPSQVNVQVLNGSGASGVAATTGAALSSRGFNVISTGDASAFNYTQSVIVYASSAEKPEVRTLKKQLADVTTQVDPTLAAGTVELILGSTYPGTLATPGASTTSKPPVNGLTKTYGGITGNASCRSDTAAFAGPNSPSIP